jgi:hypothetical protein
MQSWGRGQGGNDADIGMTLMWVSNHGEGADRRAQTDNSADGRPT